MKKTVVVLLLLSSLSVPIIASAKTETKTETGKPMLVTNNSKKSETESVSQKIHIQKVVAEKGQTFDGGKEIEKLVGVNGASFKVYDMTSILNDALKPFINLKTNADPEKRDKKIQKVMTQNEFLDKLTEQAKKQDLSKLKIFSQGNTKTTDEKDGVFEFTVPIEKGVYHAYYIVNDKVDDNNATLSEPFVLVTPVIDPDTGLPLDTVFAYPKSQLIEKEFPNTGVKGDWLSMLVNLFRG